MLDKKPKLEGFAEYIQGQLTDAYPTSRTPTGYICTEISRFMSASRYGVDDFDKAFADYRLRDKKSEFCPVLKQLRKYFPKRVDSGAGYNFFVECVIHDGWYQALHELAWANDLVLANNNDPLTEYSGMESWSVDFCQILHHKDNGPGKDPGNPLDAYFYAKEHCPLYSGRQYYTKLYQYFDGKPLEFQQRYFPYFRFQQNQKPHGPSQYDRKQKPILNDDPPF